MTSGRRDSTVSGNGRPQEIVDELGQCPDSNGFGMNPMQPALTSRFASADVPDVNATTGMLRVAVSPFSPSTTAKPSISGMW